MSPEIRHALAHDKTIDITTTGRRSGRPRRIEIWFHNVDGAIYLTGLPGRRDWYANLVSHPEFTFHLKESVNADLPATARPVTDPGERRRVLEQVADPDRLEEWVAGSPLVEVLFDSAQRG